MQSTNSALCGRADDVPVRVARRRRRDRIRVRTCAIAVALSGTCVPAVSAQVPHAQAVAVVYDIPAGSLDAALNALAQQGKIQISYAPELVAGKVVGGLHGSYTPPAALSSLLRGSKVTWKAATPTSYVITPGPGGRRSPTNDDGTHADPDLADPPVAPGGGPTAQTHTGASQPRTLQSVQVVGIRASLQKSLQTQRDSNSVVSAITAEDIGKFPNTDVAEAMTLMPGITIDRRFGQGGRVSINGTDPNLNLTYIDNHPISSVDWLFGATPDRGFSYASLPPDIVGQIEVYKTPQARLPSGSIGGVTIVHTRQPLDLPANTLTGSVGTAFNDQYGRGKPNAAVFFSWKNAADTFGANIAASYYAENIDRAGREIFAYPTVASLLPQPVLQRAIDLGHSKTTDLVPEEESAAWFRQTRQRKSVLVNAQWKPTRRLAFGGQLMYVRERFDNFNESFYAQQGVSAGNITVVAPSIAGPLSGGATGIVPSGHVCGDDSIPVCPPATTFLDNQARDSTVTTNSYSFHGEYDAHAWGVRAEYGQSWATDPSIQYFINPEYGGGFDFDILHGFTFDNQAAARNPANWNSRGNPLGAMFLAPFTGRDKYATVDVHFDFDDSFIYQLLVGGRHLRDAHSENGMEYAGGGRVGSLTDVGSTGYADINGGSAFSGFSPDMQHHIDTTRQAVKAWILNSPGFTSPRFAVPAYQIGNTWNLTQTTNAVYAQAHFGHAAWRGDLGARYVWNSIHSHTYELNGATPRYPIEPSWWKGSSARFKNVLPSFNLVYDNGGKWVYRLAASGNVAWAPYSEMVNTLSLHETFLIGTSGNPELQPYKTYNYAVSVEYYLAPQSVLAFTGFYQDIVNYLSTTAVSKKEFNPNFTANPALYKTYEHQGLCDATGLCDYSITRPGSIGGGSLKGFSIAYQQPFGDSGFGIVTNYTYADGKTNVGLALPFSSQNSITVSPYYEQGPWSVRLTYNYRSKYSAGGFVAGAAPATVAGYTELDATAGWAFSKHLSLTLSAMNLGNEAYKMYQDVPLQPLNKYTNGRRYFATLSFKL